ncbi:hypothetical protein [Rhizobium rhizoryzae]|uniref:N-acyl-D-aspartate/D-glutamate deacylase n=1 Tax=Rhizobium rhizoryzae TaxID=451876 RepID=A0A7W6LKD8_9HYPH|nr:hypothetical protein [Rhizobium rhizoryzae]MBB4146004.1 N-acyl-D-aspartate/D-glutamate deacylase [Rhizobium rhizoryzae]
MEIIIKGKMLTSPQDRVMTVEATAKAICQEAGTDPADAVMVLLTAAAHLYAQHSKSEFPQNVDGLANALGHAIGAANAFFKIKSAPQPQTEDDASQ